MKMQNVESDITGSLTVLVDVKNVDEFRESDYEVENDNEENSWGDRLADESDIADNDSPDVKYGVPPRHLEESETLLGLINWWQKTEKYYRQYDSFSNIFSQVPSWNSEDNSEDVILFLECLTSYLRPELKQGAEAATSMREFWKILCESYDCQPSQMTFLTHYHQLQKLEEETSQDFFNRMQMFHLLHDNVVFRQDIFTLSWMNRLDTRLPEIAAKVFGEDLKSGAITISDLVEVIAKQGDSLVEVDNNNGHHEGTFDQDEGQENINSDTNPFVCGYCSKCFGTNQMLTRHHKSVHGLGLECIQCGKKFPTLPRLILHGKSHSLEKPYHCEVCNQSFKYKGDIRNHMKRHNDTGEWPRPYQCDQCQSSFGNRSLLKKHQIVHSGEKKFACSYCQKRFARSGEVKKHERLHTGEKPYQCECEEAFARKDQLDHHKAVTHGEESRKKHACDRCDKTFFSKSELTSHKVKYTKETPFRCEVCEKSFARANTLKIHKHTHLKIKPFPCTVCHKGFNSMGNLQKHKSKMHPL